MKYEDNNIDYYIGGWSKKKIDGKSFDELFQIDGIPLWWFWKKYFFKYMMFKPINTFSQMQAGKKITALESLSLTIKANLLKHFISINEMRKINKSRKKKFSKKLTEEKNLNPSRVLFLSYTNHINNGNQIFRIQNIVDKIREENKKEAFILLADPLASRDEKKVPYSIVYDYYDEDIKRKAAKIAAELALKWRNINEEVKKDLISKDAVSYWPYLRYHFELFFSEEMLLILCINYEIMKKILEVEKVQCCVLTAPHNLFEKALLAAAKKKNIPAVLVQHGAGMAKANPDLLNDTKCAVFGEITKKELMETGVKEDDIVITGPVIFDGIIDHVNSEKEKTGKDLQLLLATTPAVEDGSLSKKEYWQQIEKVLDEITKIENVSVTLKLHPAEVQYKLYQRLIRRKGYDSVRVLHQQDRRTFYKLLAGCDIFLHFDSTAAIEAMILDKPVINIKISNKEFSMFADAASVITTPQAGIAPEISRILEQDRFKEKRREIVRKFCGEIDGRSHERVADLIYELSNNS